MAQPTNPTAGDRLTRSVLSNVKEQHGFTGFVGSAHRAVTGLRSMISDLGSTLDKAFEVAGVQKFDKEVTKIEGSLKAASKAQADLVKFTVNARKETQELGKASELNARRAAKAAADAAAGIKRTSKGQPYTQDASGRARFIPRDAGSALQPGTPEYAAAESARRNALTSGARAAGFTNANMPKITRFGGDGGAVSTSDPALAAAAVDGGGGARSGMLASLMGKVKGMRLGVKDERQSEAVGGVLSKLGDAASDLPGPFGAIGKALGSAGGTLSKGFNPATVAATFVIKQMAEAYEQMNVAYKQASVSQLNANAGGVSGAKGTAKAIRQQADQILRMNNRLVKEVAPNMGNDVIDGLKPVLQTMMVETGVSADSITTDVMTNMAAFNLATGKSMDEVGQLMIKRMNEGGKSAQQAADELQGVMASATASSKDEAMRMQSRLIAEAAERGAKTMDVNSKDYADYMADATAKAAKSAEKVQGVYQKDLTASVLELANGVEGYTGDLGQLASMTAGFFANARQSSKMTYEMALKTAKAQTAAAAGQNADVGYMSTMMSSPAVMARINKMTAELEAKETAGTLKDDEAARLTDLRNVKLAQKTGTNVDAFEVLKDAGLNYDPELMKSFMAENKQRGGDSFGYFKQTLGAGMKPREQIEMFKAMQGGTLAGAVTSTKRSEGMGVIDQIAAGRKEGASAWERSKDLLNQSGVLADVQLAAAQEMSDTSNALADADITAGGVAKAAFIPGYLAYQQSKATAAAAEAKKGDISVNTALPSVGSSRALGTNAIVNPVTGALELKLTVDNFGQSVREAAPAGGNR